EENFTITIPNVVVLNSADFGAAQKRRRVFCGNFSVPRPTHLSPEIKKDKIKSQGFIKTFGLSENDIGSLKKWRSLKDVLIKLPRLLDEIKTNTKVKDPNYPTKLGIGELNDHFYDTRVLSGIELYESHEMKQHHPVYGVMNFPEDLRSPARTIMATQMNVSRETIIVATNFEDYDKPVGKKSYKQVFDEHNDKSIGGFRRLTIREIACLQGFPITYQFHGESSSIKHKLIGNAVSPFISNAFAKSFAQSHFSRMKARLDRKNGTTIIDNTALKDFDKAGYWSPKRHKRNGASFYRHLRTTKSNGQRVDLKYDGEEWTTLLCLGSGKSYKRVIVDEALLGDMLEVFKTLYDNSILSRKLDSWLKKLNDDVVCLDLSLFADFRYKKCFDEKGDVRSGSPIYYIEEGIDKLIRKVVNKDYDELKEELGDLMLQVIFHSQLAQEEDKFDIRDVIEAINAKLIRRHPHIF
ncbi:hypothetical protein LCGC14_2599250, partial [marine sediment metagenome]